MEADAKNVTVTASVKNIGDAFAGKEVVQVYYSAPDGTIEKPYQELGGFGKSDLLSPGESQTITISFPTRSMASYDEKKQHGYSRQERITSVSATAPEQRKWQQP